MSGRLKRDSGEAIDRVMPASLQMQTFRTPEEQGYHRANSRMREITTGQSLAANWPAILAVNAS